MRCTERSVTLIITTATTANTISTTTAPLEMATAATAPAITPDSPRLPFRANFVWTLSGNLFYGASQWCVVALIAKLGNPEMLGEFSLAAAIVTPVLMLSGLQLRVIQATDIDGRFAFGDYLALRLLSTSFGVALIAAIA